MTLCGVYAGESGSVFYPPRCTPQVDSVHAVESGSGPHPPRCTPKVDGVHAGESGGVSTRRVLRPKSTASTPVKVGVSLPATFYAQIGRRLEAVEKWLWECVNLD